MNLKLEIICKEFKHKKLMNNKIIVSEKGGEYYIIPLTKSFDLESDEEVYKLTFENQLLWIKYSNNAREILIKEFDFQDFIVIESKDILDIYVNIHTTQCFRKNVWQSKNNTSVNKKYLGKYLLILPIFEDMIDIKEFGIGITNYQIHMNTNEILLKQAKKRSEHGCYLMLTNNVNLSQEALFVPLKDDDLGLFLP